MVIYNYSMQPLPRIIIYKDIIKVGLFIHEFGCNGYVYWDHGEIVPPLSVRCHNKEDQSVPKKDTPPKLLLASKYWRWSVYFLKPDAWAYGIVFKCIHKQRAYRASGVKGDPTHLLLCIVPNWNAVNHDRTGLILDSALTVTVYSTVSNLFNWRLHCACNMMNCSGIFLF